jgi:putative ABC transport system ATP-binding protein
MIELTNISKTFHAGTPNAFLALEGITLSLPLGRMTVFAGPSGSGKTTLLSIIGGMARPTTGRIRIGDLEITSLPERFLSDLRRNRFGFIFQDYHLIRGITALENVMLPAYPSGPVHRDLKRRALNLLERVQIEGKARSPVEWLSGGEQQRVAIARALINHPETIIADEPTAHLDSDLAAAFLEIMTGLVESGKTVLIGSHDPLVFEWMGVHRVIRMRDGRIVVEKTEANLPCG